MSSLTSKNSSKPLIGMKIAILVANGFNEPDLTIIQRAVLDCGGSTRIVSSENGMVNSWTGGSWGHNYAIDAPIGAALGADYDMLVIPGGSRSMDKLKLTAHTKRFIGSFMVAGKPVAVCGDAVTAVTFAGHQLADNENALADECADEAARRAFATKVVDSFSAYATIAREAARAA